MDRVDHLLAGQVATRPDALALTDCGGARMTWAELDAASDAARDLLEQHGVQAGDRVMILAENCAAVIAMLYACWKADAIAVPVNARQTAAEVSRVLDHAKPVVVIMSSAISADAAAHAARMDAEKCTGLFGEMHFARAHTSKPDPDRRIAVLLYTTGTTGEPKGVMLSHGNLVFGGSASANLRNMGPADLVYGVLPVTHVFGLASIVTAAAYAGAAIRLEARFSVEKLYEALREGVTLLSAVPQMHALLMQYTAAQGYATLGSDKLRYVSSGAAPLDPAWKRKAEQFYGVALQNGYGMTETAAGVSITDNMMGSDDISTGPPLPGVELRIDETTQGGGDGAGEVLVRGPHVMLGYYRNPIETAKVLGADGWLRTGDLGRLDVAGNLHILGRTRELIIHGGFNVYPPEVEAALNDHPHVIQSAVIGRMRDSDEEVLAFVQIAEGDTVSVSDLRAFVRERLAGYKRPGQIILATILPAAPTGKILKHRLLERFGDQLD